MAWTTLTLRVTTPLFNSGADSADAGVRVASIRGAMRFWFRALAGTVAGPDLKLLAALERRVFGDAGNSSPVQMRIPSPPRATRDVSFLQGRDGRWIGYLLGLGLMKPGALRLERPCVPPGGDPFELMIRFRHVRDTDNAAREAIETLAFASLWLTCTFGGIGARTRRGLGGIRIVSAPESWMLTPDLAFYERTRFVWPRESDLGRLEAHLRLLAGITSGWNGLPEYPVLSRTYSPAAIVARQFRTWEEALGYGGNQLRLFRANEPADDEQSRRKARVRTAEWADVINSDSAEFPLGALGLPVSFHDKKTDKTSVVNAVGAGGELRRASPLWLRAVGAGNSWRLFTFVMRSRFLPDGVRTYIMPGEADDAEVFVEQEWVDDLTGQWLDAMRAGETFVRKARRWPL
jgi:CRISPR/Cas system CMR-associated protein Cmr1 (group 7 of RAMP superfamily)